jgi:two-component system copper resistance phosphate regulon response regulator CusR
VTFPHREVDLVPTVLVIEDERMLLDRLRQGLEEEGYAVAIAANGVDGLALATAQTFDAVVLDLMLPGKDGWQVLSGLRANGFVKPVLILTARDSVDDRVRGLDNGADDYLVKPFAFAELLARLRALLRRDHTGGESILTVQDLEVDLLQRRVVRGSRELPLRNREFELLVYLIRHRNMTVSRHMLARDVWKEPSTVLTNIIDVQINHLRKKIESPGGPSLIHTVRGVGYTLKDNGCDV